MKTTDSQKSSVEPTPSTTPDIASTADGMDVDGELPVVQPLLVNSSTQTTQLQLKEISCATLQNYAKLIKPILSASSRLGRALTEFFGLLVKVLPYNIFFPLRIIISQCLAC